MGSTVQFCTFRGLASAMALGQPLSCVPGGQGGYGWGTGRELRALAVALGAAFPDGIVHGLTLCHSGLWGTVSSLELGAGTAILPAIMWTLVWLPAEA